MCSVYIYYVYINTHTYRIYFENIYLDLFIFISFISYINIFNIETLHIFLKYAHACVCIYIYIITIHRTRGGKSTKIFYSSKSTITLLKFYLSTSKSTSLKIYSSKSKK